MSGTYKAYTLSFKIRTERFERVQLPGPHLARTLRALLECKRQHEAQMRTAKCSEGAKERRLQKSGPVSRHCCNLWLCSRCALVNPRGEVCVYGSSSARLTADKQPLRPPRPNSFTRHYEAAVLSRLGAASAALPCILSFVSSMGLLPVLAE